MAMSLVDPAIFNRPPRSNNFFGVREAVEWQREYLGRPVPYRSANPAQRSGKTAVMASAGTIATLQGMYKKRYSQHYWTYNNELQWSIFTLQWPMIFNAALIGRE